ncbi:hypothetical protein [Nonomuraea salmonea]|uniref:hypothetical protein n=1 Tax=Nonomuraea salmonea TaxID=46181 RepID=UPI002FED7735
MPTFEEITAFITEKPLATAVIALLSLAGLVLAFLVLRVVWRVVAWLWSRYVAPRPIEDVLTVVAASIATGVSAQGMWRFSGDVLGLDGPLRLLLFAFIEVAIITSAVRARRNMRENFSAGIDGIAVWALTCLTAVLSSMDARSLPEAVFRLAAPLVAAWLWERGMAIERHRIRGTGRINWRLTPERLMVRMGLAEVSDRTASEVDAHRRLTRVALAAKKAKALREGGASERKMRVALAKLDKAMDQAVEHTGLAVDPQRQEALLAQIAALYNTSALIDADPRVPWEQDAEQHPVPARPALSPPPWSSWSARRTRTSPCSTPPRRWSAPPSAPPSCGPPASSGTGRSPRASSRERWTSPRRSESRWPPRANTAPCGSWSPARTPSSRRSTSSTASLTPAPSPPSPTTGGS